MTKKKRKGDMEKKEVHQVLKLLGPRSRMRAEVRSLRKFLKSVGCRRISVWAADGKRHCVYTPPPALKHVDLT